MRFTCSMMVFLLSSVNVSMRFISSSRPRSWRESFSFLYISPSTFDCVAIAALSVPGTQSVFLPRMRW